MSSTIASVPSWNEPVLSSWAIVPDPRKSTISTDDLTGGPRAVDFIVLICNTPDVPAACADSPQSIIDSLLLVQPHRKKTVDRLHYLLRLCADDPDEPDLDVDSLTLLVTFFSKYDLPPGERVSVGPSGLLVAEWTKTTKRTCTVGIEFQATSDTVRFAAFQGDEHISGVKPYSTAIRDLEPYLSHP